MRFEIRDLTPDTLYVVQMRYKSTDAVSEWSRLFNLRTVTDERIPNTPQNVSWINRKDAFHAEWNRVGQNTNGTGAKIARYEVELVADNGERRVKGVTPQADEKPHYDLSAAANMALFGTVQKTLRFRVRAVNQSENKSEWSDPITTSFAVPNAPQNVTWVKSEDAFVGRWSEVTHNTNGVPATIIRYECEVSANGVRKVFGITRQTDDDPDVDKTNFHLSRAENKAIFGTYQKVVSFRVRAVNAAEEKSAWSSPITKDLGTPSAPTGVTWVPVRDTLHGTWNPVTTDNDGTATTLARYEVELTANGVSVIRPVAIKSTGQPTYNLSAAENVAIFGSFQPTVTLRVRAVNKADVEGDWSAPVSGQFDVPDAPTNAVVEETVEGLKISWTPPANTSNVAGYNVYISTTAGFTPSAANRIYSGNATSATYNTSTFLLHYIVIRSFSFSGLESADLTATGTPKSPFGADATPPSTPGALAVTIDRSGTIAKANLTWTFDAATPANSDIQAFVVRWRLVGEGDNLWRMNYFDKGARSGSVELPQAYTNYEFQIASVDATANYSPWSASIILSAGIPGPPPQTTGVTTAPSLDGMQISWAPSTAADVVNGGTYRVQVAKDSAFTTGLLEYITGNTTIAVNGLDPATTYFVRVQAIDVAGEVGNYSSVQQTSTTAFPTVGATDGAPPQSSPAAIVSGGFGYLYAQWTAVPNADPVTYEVHLSTTSGFVPTLNGATKVAEVAGTSVVLEKDAVGTNLVYGVTYYVRIIAKDKDTTSGNAPAPGAQGSGSVLRASLNDDTIGELPATRIIAGNFTGGEFVIASGGILKTANSEVTITHAGIQVMGANSSISATALTTGTFGAGNALTVNGNMMLNGNFTIQNSGYITSAVYRPLGDPLGATGFRLSAAGLDIFSGVVAASLLKGGIITSADIRLGTGGVLTVDSTGSIQSNNWSATGQTGWRLNSTGLTVYGIGGTISASNVAGGTFNAGLMYIGAGGHIASTNWNGSSTGWRLSDTGFTMYNGTIQGAAVYTNQLRSLTLDATTGRYGFTINSSGYAEFAGAAIYGNTVVGPSVSTTHRIQSGNWSSGTAGWMIRADGYAEFNGTTARFKGDISGATGTFAGSVVGGGLQTQSDTSLAHVRVGYNTVGSNTIEFYGTGGVKRGSITLNSSSNFSIQGSSGEAIFITGNAIQLVGDLTLNANATISAANAIRLSFPDGHAQFSGGANFAMKLRNDTADVSLNFKNGATIFGQASWSNTSVSGGTRTDIYAKTIYNTGGAVSSDRSLKKNITTVTSAMEKIKQVKIREFDYKDTKAYGEHRSMGVIAQELQEVLPNAIRKPDEESSLFVDYGILHNLTTAATKELIEENESLKEDVQALKKQMETLEKSLKKLLDKA